jgi:hypothetical protein
MEFAHPTMHPCEIVAMIGSAGGSTQSAKPDCDNLVIAAGYQLTQNPWLMYSYRHKMKHPHSCYYEHRDANGE